jgi:hypothetical protein
MDKVVEDFRSINAEELYSSAKGTFAIKRP